MNLEQLKEHLFAPKKPVQDFEPLKAYDLFGNQTDIALGEKLIAQGKVGCLILAGGQGTRLNLPYPKALVKVSLAKEKTLLQLFCEKTDAASKKAKCALKLSLMTSRLNHDEIQEYLQKNRYFGLQEEQLSLFKQGMLPFLDPQGDPILEAPGVFAEGPDGNGGSLKAFFQSGLWKEWKQLGVEYLQVVLIDNPLADPFDANLAGYHAKQALDVTVKAVLREKEEEKVGIIVKQQDRVKVVEYSEFPEELKYEKNPDGSFVWKLANISLFCFSMDFVKETAGYNLPWHFCQKTIDMTTAAGRKERALVWKCETFIFDLLPYATRVKALLYPKEETYCPLKNAEGENSLGIVRKALLNLDRKRFFQVTGRKVDKEVFELDQAFYYPTAAFLKKWKGKPLPKTSYVCADKVL